jgi:methyl-accepting chemotaxis protein
MAFQKIEIGLFNRLLLWQKFVVVGVIFAVMAAIPSYAFFKSQKQVIDRALSSQQGLESTKDLLALVQVLPRHRGSSTGLLNGNEALAAEEKTTRELADRHIAAFDAVARSIRDDAFQRAWAEIKRDWPQVAQDVVNRSVAAPQNFDAHTRLIAAVLDVLDRVVDYTGLSLDPSAETYFLVRTVLADGPFLAEYLGQARGWGTGLLAKAAKQQGQPSGGVSLQDRARLSTMVNLARDRLLATSRDIEKTLAAAPEVRDTLGRPLETSAGMIEKVLDLSQAEIINAAAPAYSSTDYYEKYTQAINQAFSLLDAGSAVLHDQLERRAASAQQTLYAIIGALLGMFVLGALVTIYILRSITGPVGYLVGVVNRLAGGDSAVRANLETFDEIGLLGRQFDLMVDQREAVSAQIQRENETLNNSVIDLLQAVAKLAQRDLTIRVPVAEGITGPVADALNLLSGETAKVLNRVTEIARNVAQVSRQVKSQSDTVISVAAEERREVEQAAAELSEASIAMQGIADLAVSCNEAAERAIRNTDKAQESVLDTVQGIAAIRDTIRETEKRIKRLGERSQEIGGVVNLINNIAERTHILALNASMHAASAGEAGRGFAVVANEVQKLAENAREATSKISGLVNNIQVETADTVATMNEAISQVVQGTTLAQQAGGEMRETRNTTADLVQLVQRIAASSTVQAKTAQRLQERAAQIQKSTEQTFQQLQDQGQQTGRLVDFSGGLVESVSVFVLPEAARAAA